MTTLTQFSTVWQTHWPASALGWTLLHFCWQGAAVALALWCALGLLSARWPRARYGAACLALLLMAAMPVATFTRLASEAHIAAPAAPVLHMDAVFAPDTGMYPPSQPWRERVAQSLDVAAPWLPALWLVGALLFLARLSLGLLATRRMKIVGTEAAPEPLQRLLAQLAARLGVERAVKLMHSAVVQVPTVIGWLCPMVLLPVGCFAGLTEEQIETLLAHELAHIRRHDYLVSVFQSVVEALLFYHPAVWWVSRQVRQERECCCDELAVGTGGDRLAYARALSFLEERRAASPQMVLGANGGVLTMRIRRLLGLKAEPVASQAAALALLSVVVAVGCSYLVTVARAQPKATQTSIHELAAPVDGVQAASLEQSDAGEALAKPQLSYQQQKLAQLTELDRRVQAGQETLAFLEEQLRLVKQDDQGQPPERFRAQIIQLQNKIDQARQKFQQDYRELVAVGNSEATPAQVGAATSPKFQFLMPDCMGCAGNSDDFGTTSGIYKTWLLEDVRWIITDSERAAYLRLTNDNERDAFIAQFWAAAKYRPLGITPNAYKEQHYTRIAYSNEHFGTANVPGWSSNRGQMYIRFGRPDSIDAHPADGQSAYPFEVWHYNSIPGVGDNYEVKFVDTCRCGEYHYTVDRMHEAGQSNGGDLFAPAAKGLSPSVGAQPIAFKPDSTPRPGDAALRKDAISGKVVDETKSPVRGATLIATNTDNGVQTKRISDDSGAYSFPSLSAANYNVEVQADGFQRMLKENVVVSAGKTVGLDMRLTRGPAVRTVSMGIARTAEAEPARESSSRLPDQALFNNGVQAIKQGRYDAARMDLQTLINRYPDSQLVKRAQLEIATSWENQGGSAAQAEADKEYADAGLTPKRMAPGDGITPPQVIYAADPEITDEARAAKFSGPVTLNLWVDEMGQPQHVRVLRGAGYGLDEKAVEAVRQYRFKPAMQDGKPVTVDLNIEINFRIGDRPI